MRTSYTEGELLTKDDIGLVFKNGEGQEWKIVCIDETRIPDRTIVAINKDQDRYENYYSNGYFGNRFETMEYDLVSFDLVSFVGPDFTEEKAPAPQKLEFEGYVNPGKRGIYGFLVCSIYKEEVKQYMDDKNVKKYKITLEELPDA